MNVKGAFTAFIAKETNVGELFLKDRNQIRVKERSWFGSFKKNFINQRGQESKTSS